MRLHPCIDRGIALDSAIESQKIRSHRRSIFYIRHAHLRGQRTKEIPWPVPAAPLSGSQVEPVARYNDEAYSRGLDLPRALSRMSHAGCSRSLHSAVTLAIT